MPRKNKSKKEVVVDIKVNQEEEKKKQNAERMRTLMREKIFPFLLGIKETVGYTKLFLQSSTIALERVYQDKQKEIKVEEFLPRLREIFTGDKQSEKDLYIQFYELLKDENIEDFTNLLETFPRYIEQYFTKEADKQSVDKIPLEKLLG